MSYGTAIISTALLALIPFPSYAQTSRIDPALISAHSRVLSHDSMGGRDTGSPGAAAAVRYISRQCQLLGLTPVTAESDYELPVAVQRAVPIGGARIFASQLTVAETVVPDLGRWDGRVTLRGASIYMGTTDSLLIRQATSPTDIAVVQGVADADDISALAENGFGSVINLAPTVGAFAGHANFRGSVRWAHATPDVVSSFLPPLPSVIVHPRDARSLAAAVRAGQELTVELAFEVDYTTIDNVACVRPGVDRSRTIAFSAHLDHLGISSVSADGDSIFNGFSDNAAGVGMLLAIAAATATAPPPVDYVFLFFNGEERGLLGSDAFVHQPPFPLDRLAGVINLDAGAPPGRPTTWRIAGAETSLRRVAAETGELRGATMVTSGPRANTDYFPFYRVGVPAVFIVPHTGPYEGMTQAQSIALKNQWDAYHQLHDHWHEDFPFTGLQSYAELAMAIAEVYATRLP